MRRRLLIVIVLMGLVAACTRPAPQVMDLPAQLPFETDAAETTEAGEVEITPLEGLPENGLAETPAPVETGEPANGDAAGSELEPKSAAKSTEAVPKSRVEEIFALINSQPQTHWISQRGTPRGIPNFTDPTSPCSVTAVAGQAFNVNDAPVERLVIEVSGTLAGQRVEMIDVTGTDPAIGPAGYFIPLANRPVASEGSLTLQLMDLRGQPISEPIPFNTYDDCERNLVLLNMVEVPYESTRFLPFTWVTRPLEYYLPVVPVPE